MYTQTKEFPMTTIMLIFSSLSFAIVNDVSFTDNNIFIYKSVDEVDFEKGLNVNGEIIKPNSSLISERTAVKFNPLIKLRVEFNEELKSSANDIK